MNILQSNFNGLQHIGIPVTDMHRSLAFYDKLGFKKVMDKPFEYRGGVGRCCMVKHGSTILELFQLPPDELEAIHCRGNGHIDHITFGVQDIDKAFKELHAAGFTIEEDAPVFLNFWERGCRFFNVIGPDGERLEFNEILVNPKEEKYK